LGEKFTKKKKKEGPTTKKLAPTHGGGAWKKLIIRTGDDSSWRAGRNSISNGSEGRGRAHMKRGLGDVMRSEEGKVFKSPLIQN